MRQVKKLFRPAGLLLLGALWAQASSDRGVIQGTATDPQGAAFPNVEVVVTNTETGVAQNPVSVSSVAVELARKIFEDLSHKTVLLVGAGEMGEQAARNLGQDKSLAELCPEHWQLVLTSVTDRMRVRGASLTLLGTLVLRAQGARPR